MNTSTAVIGGIIIIVLIVGGAFLFVNRESIGPFSTGATTTVPSADGTGEGVPPDNGQSPEPGVPVATTNATVAPTDTTAVVTGTVIPKGALTTYWYEYGTTQSLGKKTADQMVGSGYVSIPSPGYITGLTKNTTYYFRLVAENQYGRATGAQNTVKTTEGTPAPVGGVPTSKTLAANGITRTAANLSGEVNPKQASTQYWFEYGKNAALGNTTAFVSVGDGSAVISASAAVTNLDPATTYYYRLNAQNQFGTVNGTILTFKTPGPPVTAVPVVTTQVATLVTGTSATLRGTVHPYGTPTKYWFEYGTDAQFGTGSTKTTPEKQAGSGSLTVSIDAKVSSLLPGTTYYYRTVAQNAGGTVRGTSESFTTK